MKLSVRVRPGARKHQVTGISGDVWQIAIAAPPVKGKANEELVAFLSDILDVPKSHICVVRGHTSRSKLVEIEGLSEEEVKKRLASSAVSTSK